METSLKNIFIPIQLKHNDLCVYRTNSYKILCYKTQCSYIYIISPITLICNKMSKAKLYCSGAILSPKQNKYKYHNALLG